MSINVHVSGNPISIKRGKLVTSDPDHAKNEFDKRRLMRLEQVRQQSKDIAEDVRNKVRREKKKQMKEIEKEGREKLRNWQNRKLLELQTQYENALREVGTGHKEADALHDESENMIAQREAHQQISNQRGKEAATKLHIEQNKRVDTKKVQAERKKLVREIENARSAMVAKFPKPKTLNGEPHVKKKKRKASADINITISDSDSDPSLSPSQEEDDTEESQKVDSSSLCDCTDESCSAKKSPVVSLGKDSALKQHEKDPHKSWQIPPLGLSTLQEHDFTSSSGQKLTVTERNFPCQPPPTDKPKSPEPPRDTRISDRIKRRGIMASQLDYSMKVAETHPIPYIESNTKISEALDSRVFRRPCSNPIAPAICSCSKPFENNLGVDERLNVSPDLGCTCAAGQKICHPMCGKRPAENDQQASQVNKDFGSSVSKEPARFRDIPSKLSVKLKSVGQSLTESSMPHVGYGDPVRDFPSKSKSSVGHSDHLAHFEDIPSGTSVDHGGQSSQFLDIPSKPSTKLKSLASQSDSLTQVSRSTDTNRVQFYDHPNRFTHTKKMPAFVERIPTESVEVIPDITSEREWMEKMKQRDREAQLRGKNALNKEKVRKDYEEMMKKLPLLQKKERIREIYNDKPEYHMSEERLKEKEKVKQNNLENAFNKMFPDLKPALVTLPRKTPSKENVEVSDEESVHSIDVGKWDVDFQEPKMFTAQEVQEIVRAFTGHDTKDRRAKLKELLRSLKLQKEELLREIAALPRDESLNELINDLKSVSDSEEKVGAKVRRRKGSRKRSRDRKEKDTSADSSQEHSERERERKYRYPDGSSRKKAKMKSGRKVLILQNISTQTTPKSDKKIKQPEDKTGEICSKLHALCDCNKENEKESTEELCQILIRLKDDENPDIVVKSKETEPKIVQSKSVAIGTEDTPIASKKPSPTETRRTTQPQAPTGAKPKSKTWRDQLSKNSISTSSTSYMSPPDLLKARDSQKSSLYNLRKKPQQQELSSAFSNFQSRDSFPDGTDPKLLDQIQKLLRMARGSVENLNVSSSNVQTPSQSIVEMESNIPKPNIFDMLKAFNLKIADVAEGLSYSPDFSPVPFNTSASTTESDIIRKEGSGSVMLPEKDSSTSNRSKESVLAQYADITDSCSKRIQALADMIQKLREEKIQMLRVPGEGSASKPESPAVSDKDFSTAYMDLPDVKDVSKDSTSLDEEEIYRRLMEIDLSLANKLRRFTFGEKTGKVDGRGGAEKKVEGADSKQSSSSLNSTNKELLARLKQLQQPKPVITPPEPVMTQLEPLSTSETSDPNEQPFVPFLLDIPRLPKFEAQPSTTVQTNHKRPPPSKGLTVARKFNGNISLTPHELSTIVEADSQLSTKMGSNVPSPSASISALKDIDLIVLPERIELPNSRSDSTEKEIERAPQIAVTTQRRVAGKVSPKKPQLSPTSSEQRSSTHREEKSTSSEKEYNDISKMSSSVSHSTNYCDDSSCAKKSMKKTTTSSSSDDMENIEAMLRSIGMEWAIPTLHKTQEALALTSSSSSLELASKKKGVSNESSASEVSLKEFLRKQMLSKVSSSTMKTNASPSLLGDFSDLSAIQVANSSNEKERQRTSTPVSTSKSTSKSKMMFSADSDISSVRNDSSSLTKKK